jgi:enoyl-[acyl-carrier protein] reductase I
LERPLTHRWRVESAGLEGIARRAGARIGLDSNPHQEDRVLEGKKLLITGVLTDDSIAYAVARVALENGAEILLTNVGKGVRLTERVTRKLPRTPDVMQMDVNSPDDIAAVAQSVSQRWGRLDGVLHSIGFAPQDALGGNFLNTPWESVATAFQTSAYSLKGLTVGLLEPLKVAGADGGASVVALTFDGRYAWPIYDWMGVAKAGLESITRYLARDLGPSQIRVNTVSAGPIRTMAGKSIPGFDEIAGGWLNRSPLPWSLTDATPVGQMCCFLLSPLASMTTGELIHVDGGYHAMGTDIRVE